MLRCLLFSIVPLAVAVFRPPAIPLITTDPYMQTWLMGDEATSDVVRHWDRRDKEMLGLMRVDGEVFRFLGACDCKVSCGFPALRQLSVDVLPTRTIFRLRDPADRIELNVTFLSTLFSHDYPRLSRPVSYVVHDLRSLSGAEHDVELYFDMSAQHVVDSKLEEVRWGDFSGPASPRADAGKPALAIRGSYLGTLAQRVLGKNGDRTNINWGYLYLADGSRAEGSQHRAGSAAQHRAAFSKNGSLPGGQDTRMPRACWHDMPALSVVRHLPGLTTAARHVVLVGYDDIRSISFYDEGQFPALWTQTWPDIQAALAAAAAEVEDMLALSAVYDASLLSNLTAAGGRQYAAIGALAYRQTLAATKLTWNPKRKAMWNFMKEISTDGDLNTMDVIYPSSPLLLYSNPDLLRMLLLPVLAFANNETSTHFTDPFSPHELGQYPIADHDTKQQEPMPMENTGNMFLMLAGLAQTGTDMAFLSPYWSMLRVWADYLQASLPFPANQLCTDDFTGRLANNTNLAAKGIVALEAFALLCEKVGLGDADQCSGYRSAARRFAQTWQAKAWEGDHYRIAFDVPGSYSIKYNLLWQKLLRLSGPFDWSAVAPAEVKYYISKANAYGTPMDHRHAYVKLDWLSWAAALADDEASFHALHDPIFKQANASACCAPLTDLFDTETAACAMTRFSFVARPVVGGVFAKMLLSSGGFSGRRHQGGDPLEVVV